MSKQKDLLIKIANELLLTDPLETSLLSYPDKELASEIQIRFQKEIITSFHRSKFSQDVTTIVTEAEILDHLANIASGTQKITLGYLPKVYNVDQSGEMECTLTSAFLKLAYEERGIKNVRTCLLNGHQVTIKVLIDGSIYMFDAANTHTIDGMKHGFSCLFTFGEVTNKKKVFDRFDESDAFTFIIKTTRTPQALRSEILDKQGEFYSKIFYAHSPDILISLSVIIDNLNDEQIKKKYPFLEELDYDRMKEQFNLLDKDSYLKRNT